MNKDAAAEGCPLSLAWTLHKCGLKDHDQRALFSNDMNATFDKSRNTLFEIFHALSKFKGTLRSRLESYRGLMLLP